jgi:hypothetical protein
MIEMIQRHVKGYGWLPIITKNGKEVYRGEYQATPDIALEKSILWLENQE